MKLKSFSEQRNVFTVRKLMQSYNSLIRLCGFAWHNKRSVEIFKEKKQRKIFVWSGNKRKKTHIGNNRIKSTRQKWTFVYLPKMPSKDPLPPKESALFRKILVNLWIAFLFCRIWFSPESAESITMGHRKSSMTSKNWNLHDSNRIEM